MSMITTIKNRLFTPTAETEKPLCEMKAKGKHADIYIYGRIGGWSDNTASRLAQQIRSRGNLDSIHVHLSTMGGSFLDGLPIYNTLRQHKASVTVTCMGYALSMGSVLLQAASVGQRQICQNGIIMLHRAQGWEEGDAEALRKQADVMETHEAAIIPRFMEVMNLPRETVEAILQAETWYTADQALAAGLVDDIIDPVDLDEHDEAMPENAWQTTQNYKHPPVEFQVRAQKFIVPHTLNHPTTATPEEDTMTPEQLESLQHTMQQQTQHTQDFITQALTQQQQAHQSQLNHLLEQQQTQQTELLNALKSQNENLSQQQSELMGRFEALSQEAANQTTPPEHGSAADNASESVEENYA